jgi:hypothetical protein
VRCVVLARLRGCRVSTTILYLAIVGIWAGFLVPAWIRRPHGTEADADFDEFDADGADAEPDVEDVAGGSASADDELVYAESDEGVGADADHLLGADSVPERPLPAAPVAPPVPPAPQSRQQMLRARRRVLAILLAVAVGAAAGVARGLLPWWTAGPPMIMLALYVLLLREVAKAEAEVAGRRRRDLTTRAARPVGQERRGSAGWAVGPEPIAEVIDISSRVGDELYDQYADAAVRAVGD